MDRSTLENKPVSDLREIAKQLDITGSGRMRKADLIDEIIGQVAAASEDGDDGGGGGSARDEVIERRRARASGNGSAADDADDSGDDNDASDDGDGSDDGDSDDDSGDDDSGDDGNGGDGNRSRSRSRARRGRGRKDLDGLEEREGVLDLLPEGYGFLRTTGYVAGPKDVYVSQSYVRRFNLRRGDLLGGPVRYNKGNDKFPALARLETCEGAVVDNEHDPLLRDRPDFDEAVAVHPSRRLALGGDDAHPLLGEIDEAAPQGHGQRTLVIADRGAGSTGVLVEAARSLAASNDDLTVLLVLVAARPEQVTEVERSLEGVEVVATSFDQQPEDHTALAELAVERARRLAERGQDVVVLLDSLTTLARAYHQSGQGAAGELDASALLVPKQLFGAARALEDAGTVTMLAVASVDGVSTSDDSVLEEFRGTGNSQVRLVRADDGADTPALVPDESGTRRAELLD